MYHHIYLAQTPTNATARRHLRARALDLAARLAQVGEGPCAVILGLDSGCPDLVVLRPHSVIAALIHQTTSPLDQLPDRVWVERASGERVLGGAPLAAVRAARSMLVRKIEQHSDTAALLGRLVGALVIAPTLPADSRIVLDIGEHRDHIKLLGLDELAPLAAMLQAGARLDELSFGGIIAALDARLWHNGERLLFEVGLAAYQLNHTSGVALTLLEGANVIGRRAAPLQGEFRLTIEGDDTISADHAVLICLADGRAVLRDTSTNGTYLRAHGGEEQRIHHAEQPITAGSTIRMGETVLRLERVP
ncbi:MAG: FHA domain-containing protein [Roseiflexaceae bacterium]|nr:FHA domain-containing protein [Roseiflexaceae bacterium]